MGGVDFSYLDQPSTGVVTEPSDEARALLPFLQDPQAEHLGIETSRSLERLPALFGLPAMPLSVFVGFNLTRLGIWVASVPGLRSARGAAFFAAWFLAIAGMLNGIAHPLLGVAAGGYFPGLVTSPFIGGASVWLWLRLRRATRLKEGWRLLAPLHRQWVD